jgi:prepilin-type N-terminal cleavage/methylation domain-containing protein
MFPPCAKSASQGNPLFRRCPGSPAFSLLEILSVLAIMGILVSISVPAIQSERSALTFNSSVDGIAGILSQARAYATGKNTYVWVAFYPFDPSGLSGPATDQSGEQVYVATYASADGTDPIQWGADMTSVPIPYVPSGNPAPAIFQVGKVALFKQLHLETVNFATSTTVPSLPAALNNPTPPLSTVSFQLAVNNPSLTLSAQALPSDENAATLVVGFTPSGSAQVSSSPVNSIGLDLQPMKAPGIKNVNNLAAVRINGLVGLTTVYRK